MSQAKGSRWWCDVCLVAVWVNSVPRRFKHQVWGRWMVRKWPPVVWPRQ
jgi:hypothetical protein